ncbi:MAG: putative sensory transduction regulatory protein [Betaproteobacteria bacterium]|nr:putative sensory transduction regulatory protein [Betaproteobacteria bacterium]
MLVEDNKTDAELTLRALNKNKIANNIFWVKDGAEALEFIFATGAYAGRTSGLPKLILLDLKLPKVDGIEVLTRVKNDPLTKSIPVVMVTSSAEERDIVESYKLGVNSYLVKPVDFNQFVNVVAQAGLYWAVLNRTAR